MKATTILTRCRNAEADKQRIRQQIQRRREAMACISPRMDATGGGRGTAEPDKIAAFVAAVDVLERKLKMREGGMTDPAPMLVADIARAEQIKQALIADVQARGIGSERSNSCSDIGKRTYQQRYDDYIMTHLGMKSPNEVLAAYNGVMRL